jgi:hypothetical protein
VNDLTQEEKNKVFIAVDRIKMAVLVMRELKGAVTVQEALLALICAEVS